MRQLSPCRNCLSKMTCVKFTMTICRSLQLMNLTKIITIDTVVVKNYSKCACLDRLNFVWFVSSGQNSVPCRGNVFQKVRLYCAMLSPSRHVISIQRWVDPGVPGRGGEGVERGDGEAATRICHGRINGRPVAVIRDWILFIEMHEKSALVCNKWECTSHCIKKHNSGGQEQDQISLHIRLAQSR